MPGSPEHAAGAIYAGPGQAPRERCTGIRRFLRRLRTPSGGAGSPALLTPCVERSDGSAEGRMRREEIARASLAAFLFARGRAGRFRRFPLRHQLTPGHEPELHLESFGSVMPLPNVIGPFTDLPVRDRPYVRGRVGRWLGHRRNLVSLMKRGATYPSRNGPGSGAECAISPLGEMGGSRYRPAGPRPPRKATRGGGRRRVARLKPRR